MLFRKLIRTALKYKAQFISMIIMVAIGVGVFLGMNMEWYSMQINSQSVYELTKFADYRIYNEQGFTESQAEAVKNIDGVEAASRVLSVNVKVKDTSKSLGLFCTEEYIVSTMYVTSGAEYDEDSDGFWLSDRFAEANAISIGDTLTVTSTGMILSGEVVGLVKSGEFLICVADENQLMPDYNSYGFVYASPKKVMQALGADYYTQINVISALGKEEMEECVNAALGATTLVLSKDESYSYSGIQSEIEEGQTMGSILPVLFLLIGVLTMITTMHRITVNEKTQIGTLKALGFKDRRILLHYTSYGLALGIVGSLLGIGLGYGIAALIVGKGGTESTYMDMLSWGIYAPWYCWLIVIAMIAVLTFICFLSVKKMLVGTAADCLRPYTPKKMKALALEKTKAWDKLSFATKWNLRDVMRHKSRSIMTLLGVLGCMILLVGGLGMKDTMDAFIDVIDDVVYNYETRVYFAATADPSEVVGFAEDNGGDWLSSSSVRYGGKAVTLEVYDVTHDMIRFLDTDNNRTTLSDDGAYVCIRLSDGIKAGDYITFSPYGSDETYTVKIAGVLRSCLTENIVMTAAYADSVGLDYRINSVFTDAKQSEIYEKYGSDAGFISDVQSKQTLMESYDSFMEILNTMVLVFVFAAVVLGVVVLYNLGVMSYIERYRELATLKVVGFKDGRIGKILISQNIWLTVLGVILGLPAGAGVLCLLVDMLATEYELKVVIGALSYVVGILVTFGVSLVVGLFVARKNKKVDMVEALKGAE